MSYAVGLIIAVVSGAFAKVVGFDRDRAFYPAVLIVTASYYVLFAVMGGSERAIIIEIAVTTVFVAAAIAGFRFNAWLIVAGLLGHGVFDLFHASIVTNPGMPVWWPSFCMTFDVVLAAILAWIVVKRGAATDAARGR